MADTSRPAMFVVPMTTLSFIFRPTPVAVKGASSVI